MNTLFSEALKLKSVLKVLNGLRPLAYVFRDDLEARSIITINDKNELSVVDLFHSEDQDSSSIVNTEYIKKTIVIVTSQMFTPDHSILITTENQDNNNTQYANFFHDSLLNKANSMFYSDSTPIIVADPMTLTPLVIYSKSGQLYSGYFDENKNFIQESFKESTANKIRAPSGVHFSSFIDVVGNLHSQLVLHSKDNSGNNYLNIYELDQDRKLVQISSEIRLPSNIGPILFGETHIQPDESKAYKSHVPDIIYVSEDGDSFFLNIHKNQELASDSTEEKKIFSDRVNLPFTEFLGQKSEYKPVLKNKDGNPSGIFLADLLGTGVNDIFITAKHNSKSEYKVIVLSFNFETKKYELNKKCNLDTIISYYYIHSVSVCDLDNTGSLNIMVTAQNEPSGALESYVTVPYEFDGKEEETGITFLILGTLKNSTKTFYIPGSVVEMMYEYNRVKHHSHPKLLSYHSSLSNYLLDWDLLIYSLTLL